MIAKESEKNKDLEGMGKPQDYLQFVEFMALPSFLREKVFGFKTGGDFGTKYNVSIDTLTDWKKKDGFWDRVKEARTKWVQEKVSDVLASLYRKIIKDGSASEVKLFLQYAGEFEETLRVEGVALGSKLNEEEQKLLKDVMELDYGKLKDSTTGEDEPRKAKPPLGKDK